MVRQFVFVVAYLSYRLCCWLSVGLPVTFVGRNNFLLHLTGLKIRLPMQQQLLPHLPALVASNAVGWWLVRVLQTYTHTYESTYESNNYLRQFPSVDFCPIVGEFVANRKLLCCQFRCFSYFFTCCICYCNDICYMGSLTTACHCFLHLAVGCFPQLLRIWLEIWLGHAWVVTLNKRNSYEKCHLFILICTNDSSFA